MNKLTATVVLLGLTMEGVTNATNISQPKNKLNQLKMAPTQEQQEMPKPYNLAQL